MESGRDDYRFGVRVRRALARRLPRAHRGYNWLRIQGGHHLRRLLRRLVGLLSPRRTLATVRWLATLLGEPARRRRERRLTVGVEVAALWEPLTGVGWYLHQLLAALGDSDAVRLRLYGPSIVASPDLVPPHAELPRGAAVERVLHEVPEGLVLPRGLLIRLLRRMEPLLIAADGNDVLFAPNYFLPRRFRLARGARVVTVHDLGLRTVPWTLRPETLAELAEQLEHSIFEAARLISVSGAVRDELEHYGYAQPQRVTVVHHGPGQLSDVEPGALPEGLPGDFALHVGTLEPRKNLPMLLEAWRRLRRRLPSAPALVLCGRYGWKAEGIRAAVERGVEEGWLHHPGYVTERVLAALYGAARLLAFPSLYEGFGLPAVEAFHAGTPVVCSDIPALREVAGDAALFAAADRPDLFAAAVERLLTDAGLRERMVERGRRRVAALSWERSGARTVEVWRRAAGRAPAEEGL